MYVINQNNAQVEIIERDAPSVRATVRNGEADLFLGDWYADYPDPENFSYPLFHSSNKGPGGNYAFLSDTALDGMIERARSTPDTLEKARLSRAIDARVFELAPWKAELTETYSHGMRQKLIIAGALVHRPEVIVVDEPMVGLDPKSARLLKELFREYVTRGGTVLMSTHTMEIAEVMCDRIAIVYRGKIAAQGTMEELRQQTSSEGMSLEDLFLKLTGGHQTVRLDTVLDA